MDATQSKRITVLHVVGGVDASGGVMHVATELARVVTPTTRGFVWKHRDFSPARSSEIFVCEGRARRTDVSLASDVVGALKEVGPLVRWVRSRENVVLHAHSRLGIFAACFASRITGCPLVVHFHALWNRRSFYRAAVKAAGAVPVFNSTKTCRFFGFDPTKSVVTMPSIVWPAAPASNGGRKRFVAAGSFVLWKNLPLTVAAFNNLCAKGCDAELHFFGRSDRPVRKEEQDYIISLCRTNPAIKVRDYDVNWASTLTAQDVLVHAADTEPFGIVILEGFAKGCRCVVPSGTFLDELPETIRSSGVWRARAMDVAGLEEQMGAAMAKTVSAEELCKLRRGVADLFSAEKTALKLSTVYESML